MKDADDQRWLATIMASNGMVKKMHLINPKRNFAFTAVETLTDEDEMRQFLDDYAAVQQTYDGGGGNVRRIYNTNAERVIRSNMEYIPGYYSEDTRRRWGKVLSGWKL